MVTERYVPETQYEDRPHLRECDDCGVHYLVCGRMIDRDGAIWPLRDTGFRMTHMNTPRQLPRLPENIHALGMWSPHAFGDNLIVRTNGRAHV